MSDTVLGWHFLADTGLLRDGSTPPPGSEWLRYDGQITICESGLHGSEHAMDALRYAPGAMVCRCEFRDVIDRQCDKLVARERRILWRADATATLRSFARTQASRVLHLWAAPQVVRDYLATGDESLRAAAETAAWDAVRAAAETATWDAARAAAETAAWAAAEAAARAAAWDAAKAAAETATWDAAKAAAETAARATLTAALMALAPQGPL